MRGRGKVRHTHTYTPRCQEEGLLVPIRSLRWVLQIVWPCVSCVMVGLRTSARDRQRERARKRARQRERSEREPVMLTFGGTSSCSTISNTPAGKRYAFLCAWRLQVIAPGHTRARAHARTHARTHAHTRTHTHTHEHARAPSGARAHRKRSRLWSLLC